MVEKGINNKNLEDSEYVETPRELLVDKLAMIEMLNADDFNVLLQIAQEEFKRTFCISKDLEGEKEIE